MLHDVLKRDHSGLFDFLREHRMSTWITVHLTAEDDHFEQAFVSATRAFEFCTSERTDVLERRMLEGIDAFARFQGDCMRVLASPMAEARAPSAAAHFS